MERRVNKFKIIAEAFCRLFVNRLFFYCRKICRVNVLSDYLDKTVFYRLVVVGCQNVVKNIKLVDNRNNVVRAFGRKLTAVLTICLVSVVFFRVVARGYNNSCRRFFVSYRKRKHRCGTERLKKVCFNSVCRKRERTLFCKFVRLMARIVRDNNSAFHIFFAFVFNVLAKSLCRFFNGIYIHSVVACADNSAESARSEFQIFYKSFLNFVVVVFYGNELFSCFFINFR